MILIGKMNIQKALSDENTWKLYVIHTAFLLLMIFWSLGSWCRVKIFKINNATHLWKYRYRFVLLVYKTDK